MSGWSGACKTAFPQSSSSLGCKPKVFRLLVSCHTPLTQTCGPEQPSPSFAHLLLGYDVSPSARGVEDSILLPRAEFSVLTAIEKVRKSDTGWWRLEEEEADLAGGCPRDAGCWGLEQSYTDQRGGMHGYKSLFAEFVPFVQSPCRDKERLTQANCPPLRPWCTRVGC